VGLTVYLMVLPQRIDGDPSFFDVSAGLGICGLTVMVRRAVFRRAPSLMFGLAPGVEVGPVVAAPW
jgi:hypothetical protein